MSAWGATDLPSAPQVSRCDNGVVGPRLSCPAFVGRTEELALLDQALVSVVEEGGTTLLIGGDAGVGKTRLIAEWRAGVRGRGVRVATGFCSPGDAQGRAYGSLIGILRDLDVQLPAREGAQVLGPVYRALGLPLAGAVERESAQPEPPAGDELAKTRLLDTILACVTTLADPGPTVLVFEDLHWADSATADLIDVLARNLGPGAVMLIGTYRSDELVPGHPMRTMVAELGRHSRVAHVELGGLDRDQLGTIVAGILGHEPDLALADAVYSRSEGNPFFAEELVAARDVPRLPPLLRDVIMLRVGRLSAHAQHVLAVTATAGGSVDHRLLSAVCDLDGGVLEAAIAETIDRQLLVVSLTGTGYEVRHALLSEAVYDSLLPSERVRLHRGLAEALTAHPELRLVGPGHAQAELAGHWWAAGAWNEAFLESLKAADAAESVFAFVETHTHLERALAAWERAPDAALHVTHLELLGRAADVAHFACARQRAVEWAKAAVEEVDATAEPGLAALCLARLGRVVAAVDSQQSLEALRRAASLLPADPPSVERARVLAEQGRCLMMLSRFHEAEALCVEAIRLARSSGSSAEEGHATNTLGCCRAGTGHLAEGIGLLRTALQIAEDLGSPGDLNRACTNLSDQLLQAGRLHEAAAVSLDAAAMGQALGGIRLEGAAVYSAEALFRLGQCDTAEALLSERGGSPGMDGNMLQLVTALMALRRGRFDDARNALVVADELTAGQVDVQWRGRYLMLMAELALEEGRWRDASSNIDHALSLAALSDDRYYAPEMCALGIRALADGHDDTRTRRVARETDTRKAQVAAAELADKAERMIGASTENEGVASPPSQAFALVCRAEESRLTRSDPAIWEAAANAWEQQGQCYHEAYCRWHQAAALLAETGDRRRATDLLQRAWRVSKDTDAAPLRTKIEHLAHRARISISSEDRADSVGSPAAKEFGLTAREIEVLGQLAAHRTDAEIAKQLYISKKTASVHVSNLLRKLGVSSRLEAGDIGQQIGLA